MMMFGYEKMLVRKVGKGGPCSCHMCHSLDEGRQLRSCVSVHRLLNAYPVHYRHTTL